MRPRRQVRRLEGIVRVLRPHEFDLAASFRQGGRQDREAAAHGLQVGAGDVEEQIPRIRRELRQDPVDHRRETEDLPGGVGDDREKGLGLNEMGILPTFLVLREDLREVYLLRQPEWRKADGLRSDRLVREGRRDAIEVVDPDGHLLPLASHAHVELLLQVDDRSEEVVVQFEAADDAADRERSDVRDAPFDDEVKARGSDRVYGEAPLEPEEPPQPAGDPFYGIAVRPIREDVERHHVVLDALRPRAHVRDPIDTLLEAQTLPEQVDEILVSNVDVGQGRGRYRLAIYTISRPSPLDDRRRGAVGCAARGRVQVDAPDDEGDRGTPPDRWPGTEATVPNGRNAERDDGSRLEGDGGARSPVRDQRRDRRGVGACCRTGVRGREVSPVIPSGRDSSPD